jgi:malonyl-CoA decarboxylase
MNENREATDEKPRHVQDVLKVIRDLEDDDAPLDFLFQQLRGRYESLNEREKEALFKAIIEKIEVSKEAILPVLESLLECDPHDPRWPSLLSRLRDLARSPRLNLFRKVSRSPGGLKFLLDFRGDLLVLRRYSTYDLGPLDSDIVFLFEMWFQEGFLYLEEITFDSAYKQIELIKDRDLVHPMASIDEMGQRLGEDRRCFALYHRLMPYEPIVFIEVALTKGLVKNIADIMASAKGDRKRTKVDTAIFYSINNTQNGLASLGLGKMLIGKVVDYIREENEEIKNFATLSPVPAFWERYLRPLLEGKEEKFDLKPKDILSFFPKKTAGRILERGGGGDLEPGRFNAALLSILSDEGWAEDEDLRKDLHNPLIRIAYHHVSQEKNPQGKPLNPVAAFHLGNGASVSQGNVNFLANPSRRGLKESCGIMVNYVYTTTWLSQFRRSFRWFDRMEIKGLFSRRPFRG